MTAPAIRLHLLEDACDADGLPRAALEVPSQPGAIVRRPLLLLFPTIALAVAEKAKREASA